MSTGSCPSNVAANAASNSSLNSSSNPSSNPDTVSAFASGHGALAHPAHPSDPSGTPTSAVCGAVATEADGSRSGAVGGAPAAAVAAPPPHGLGAAARRTHPSAHAPVRHEGRAPASRGPADPVKALLYRHRELCERAVDPLEVAVGLEAAGITDRTVARFRHRDVFSLAEEMYARVAHADEADGAGCAAGRTPAPWRGAGPGARLRAGLGLAWSRIVRVAVAHSARLRRLWACAGWFVVALLPGAAGVLLLAGLRLTTAGARLVVGAGGALAAPAAFCLALRYGPLRARRRSGIVTRACTCVLLGYALLGDALMRAALADGGPGVLGVLRRALATLRALPSGDVDAPWAPFTAPGTAPPGHWSAGAAHGTGALHPLMPAPFEVTVLVLTFAVVPAACGVRLFTAGARRRVARNRCLAEFAAAMRPLLFAVVAGFLWSVTVLLTLAASVVHEQAGYAGVAALGALLMPARLLAVHGLTRVPALALGAAGATEALTLGAVCAAHLPGCPALGAAVGAAVGAVGPGLVPGVACGAAAVALLAYATHALTRASAHPSGHAAAARPPSGRAPSAPSPGHPAPAHPSPGHAAL